MRSDQDLRNLERLADQGDLSAYLQWVDVLWRMGHPLGNLLRLMWAQDYAFKTREEFYNFLGIPCKSGKIPISFRADLLLDGIQITVFPGKSVFEGARRKSSQHRIIVRCFCGTDFSIGRLSQHLGKHIPTVGGWTYRKKKGVSSHLLQKVWGQRRFPDSSGYMLT